MTIDSDSMKKDQANVLITNVVSSDLPEETKTKFLDDMKILIDQELVDEYACRLRLYDDWKHNLGNLEGQLVEWVDPPKIDIMIKKDNFVINFKMPHPDMI